MMCKTQVSCPLLCNRCYKDGLGDLLRKMM